VERAEREATMEEIVVALRETRRDAGRTPPLTIVGRQSGGSWASALALRGSDGPMQSYAGETAAPSYAEATADIDYPAAPIDIAALREAEIERLLGDNTRLQDRVIFLLKVIEREQGRPGPRSGQDDAERGAVVREVKAALESELRPILLVLLRVLETQTAAPAAAGSGGGRLISPDAAPVDRRRDR
jgi:hypothetical protein